MTAFSCLLVRAGGHLEEHYVKCFLFTSPCKIIHSRSERHRVKKIIVYHIWFQQLDQKSSSTFEQDCVSWFVVWESIASDHGNSWELEIDFITVLCKNKKWWIWRCIIDRRGGFLRDKDWRTCKIIIHMLKLVRFEKCVHVYYGENSTCDRCITIFIYRKQLKLPHIRLRAT